MGSMPDWMAKAAIKGDLASEIEGRMHEEFRRGISMGVGWTFGECCSKLDAGEDPRNQCQGKALNKALEDLKDKNG